MPGIAISEQTGQPQVGIIAKVFGGAHFKSSLARMLSDIAFAETGTPGDRDRDIAGALTPYLGRPGLLDDVACPGDPAKYARYLLHAGAGYSVLALVCARGKCRRSTPIEPGAYLASIKVG
jgi:hypothetical protein